MTIYLNSLSSRFEIMALDCESLKENSTFSAFILFKTSIKYVTLNPSNSPSSLESSVASDQFVDCMHNLRDYQSPTIRE